MLALLGATAPPLTDYRVSARGKFRHASLARLALALAIGCGAVVGGAAYGGELDGNDALFSLYGGNAAVLPIDVDFEAEAPEPPFVAEIAYASGNVQNRVRIGSGGNIYSWRANGRELMPPQSSPFSQWVDDVFQVVLAERQAGAVRREGGEPFFIHQAGTYRLDKSRDGPSFYSPALQVEWDAARRSLYILSWPQQAHIPTSHRSDVILLTRWRRVTETLLEASFVLVNSGVLAVEWMNVPWGGVRPSVLPDLHYLADNAFELLEAAPFGEGRKRAQTTEAGSAFWSEPGSSEERLALGVGFPAPAGPDRSVWRWGLANPKRDFYVGTSAGPISLSKGDIAVGRYLIGAGRAQSVQADLLIHPQERVPFLVIVENTPGELPVQSFCADPDDMSGKSKVHCDVQATLNVLPDSVPLFRVDGNDGRPQGLVSDVYHDVPHGADGLEVWRWPEDRLHFSGFTGRVETDPACNNAVVDIAAVEAEAIPFVCRGSLR